MKIKEYIVTVNSSNSSNGIKYIFYDEEKALDFYRKIEDLCNNVVFNDIGYIGLSTLDMDIDKDEK